MIGILDYVILFVGFFQMYSPAAMYAAAGYPGYIGYPVQYYPYYPASAAAAAMQPSIQPLRPTIMIPVNIRLKI